MLHVCKNWIFFSSRKMSTQKYNCIVSNEEIKIKFKWFFVLLKISEYFMSYCIYCILWPKLIFLKRFLNHVFFRHLNLGYSYTYLKYVCVDEKSMQRRYWTILCIYFECCNRGTEKCQINYLFALSHNIWYYGASMCVYISRCFSRQKTRRMWTETRTRNRGNLAYVQYTHERYNMEINVMTKVSEVRRKSQSNGDVGFCWEHAKNFGRNLIKKIALFLTKPDKPLTLTQYFHIKLAFFLTLFYESTKHVKYCSYKYLSKRIYI